MSATTGNRVETTEKALVFHRTFDAPIDIVFAMFTDAHIAEWWAPRPYRAISRSMDFREGGIWHYEMVGPQDEMTGSSVITTFHEITPPTRIVMSDYFVDADGAATMEIYGSTKTIVLADRGTQTELTLTAAYPTAEGLQGVLAMGMVEGMGIALDQLHAYVEAQ